MVTKIFQNLQQLQRQPLLEAAEEKHEAALVGFAEAGNSWASYSDYNPFHLYKTVGMGARIFMPAFGMLGLDYGWGLDEVPGNPGGNENRFTFTIGQQIR